MRHWLDDVAEIRIHRSRSASVRRHDATLTIGLADRYASNQHLLARATPEGFIVSDEGSTNGTFVDGRRLAPGEERLVESGLLEVGHTFFHLRTDVRGTRDAATDADPEDPLTFQPEFAMSLTAAGRLVRRAHDMLITGESGVGKEVLARWLHRISGRKGPLVAVNCAAVPEHLLEDELFGHVKGAFSGAVGDRPGLLRAAHQGTLLLDEVGDMPAPLQAKLLRVIEDRRVRPVGSEEEVQVDVQIIAATHRDLRSLVDEGRFREDLLARLGLLPLRVPPLRARREDLGVLIRRVVKELPRGLERVRFELDALRMLLLHSWPLNVRELRRALLAAIDLAGPDEREPVLVGPQHLPPALERTAAPPSASRLSEEDRELRARLVTLLARHRGNVAAVAREMGRPRTGVQRLMARLGVDRPAD
ncbi:MAG TPA: sigma 54-interacting transcriptional regulator [Myxococcaceae bacterium]|nr:sigma 54-interacting transcriptional regulator [Myxococcaceae bacterium]